MSKDGDNPEPEDFLEAPHVSAKRWEKIYAALPERGPYEEEATDGQRDRLWRMGFTDTGILGELGRVQAAWLIAQGGGGPRKQGGGCSVFGVVIVLFVTGVVAAGVYQRLPGLPQPKASPTPAGEEMPPVGSVPMPVIPTSTATSQQIEAATPKPTPNPAIIYTPGMKVELRKEVTLSGPHGKIVVNPGNLQTVLRVEGGRVVIGDEAMSATVTTHEITPVW